jgi:hypothetical protein
MRARELLQKPGIAIVEVRKGSTMFKTTIVVWLVLLVLALNAVAFVARIIDRCRLPHDLSITSEGTVPVAQTSQPAIEASTKTAETRIGTARSAPSVIAAARN